MKQSLKVSANDRHSLCQRLSSYLLGYRTTAHANTGVPPCQLLQGRDLRMRLSLLRPDPEKSVRDEQKSLHDPRAKLRQWSVGDRVLVQNYHNGIDWIPATIIEVLGLVTYLVETEQGYKWKRHSDQIKNWLISAPCPDSEAAPDEVETNDESNGGRRHLRYCGTCRRTSC